jgi:hypothetical protein
LKNEKAEIENASMKRSPARQTSKTPSTYRLPNGLRYLRWGGDGEAVQPEKG